MRHTIFRALPALSLALAAWVLPQITPQMAFAETPTSETVAGSAANTVSIHSGADFTADSVADSTSAVTFSGEASGALLEAEPAADSGAADSGAADSQNEPDPAPNPAPDPDPAPLEGWQTIDGLTYYYGQDGSPITGTKTWEDGTFSVFDSTGVAQTGWLKKSGLWYYLDPETCISAQGMRLINGYTYYLDPSSGAMVTGWKKISGTWYYFAPSSKPSAGQSFAAGPSGHMVTGWLKTGGKWYFLDQETGAMATGPTKVGSSWYLLASSGAMQSGGWVKQDGLWYYLSSSGKAATGWLKWNGGWYYLNPQTAAMATGWQKVGSHTYYLQSGGVMASGWLKISGTWYYFDQSTSPKGHLCTGWKKLNGSWYYLDPQTGGMQTGWIELSGKRYYLNASGAMTQPGWHKWTSTEWRFFFPDGSLAVGEQTIDGIPYDFGEEGTVTTRYSASLERLISSAQSTPWYGAGTCAYWVTQVYTRANWPTIPQLHPRDMYATYCHSSNQADLRPGMLIAVPSSPYGWDGASYGHVGIYLGAGKVADSVNSGLRVVSLSTWLAEYQAGGAVAKWGYPD